MVEYTNKSGNISENIRTFALPFEDSVYNFRMMFEYDSWGRTTSITYPDGETVSYDYDRGGQLFRMYNAQLTMYNYLDSVLYDKFGAVTSRKYGNGLKMQYAYHPQNHRLTAISTYNGNSQLSHTAYSYDPAGNITQAVGSYPWLVGQTFTETFAYDSTHQLVSATNAQTYALSVSYGDWGKIQQYGLQQTDLASNTTTGQTRYYSYGSLNEGQTTFAPNNISYADGTNVNEQYGINGSLLRRETTIPNTPPSEELYRFGADGNLRLYSYDRLFFALYGYDAANTRTFKYSMDLSPNWVNGRLESVNFNLHNAMFYPNSYLNFNANGYYTKHYYNGMERIASRLGDQNISIDVNDPELQDRKDWQDSLIRKNVTEITGYDFLPVGEEQNPDDPKPIFELPQVGLNNLIPNTSAIYYYHPNHLGSTCYVTDGNAIVQQGFLYAPFGEITNEHNVGWQSGTLPKYSFNAKELDEETGMYYYEARYMAPPVFISRDPLFEKYPTFSPYAYCANNPVKFIDPTGEEIVIDNYDGYGHSIKYKPNMRLTGTKAARSQITALNEMIKTEAGWKLIYNLDKSDKKFYITDKSSGTEQTSATVKYKNGAMLKMGGNNDLRSISHELFHAFQFDKGQGGATYFNEIEAYVFSEIVATQYINNPNAKTSVRGETAMISRHPETSRGKEYEKIMEKLAKSFSVKLFNKAVDLFQEQSGANAGGIYDSDYYKKRTGKEKHLLQYFYPKQKK